MKKVVAMFLPFCSLPHFKRFIIPLLLVSSAALLYVWPLQSIDKNVTLLTFYPAVILATIYGGLPAGLITTSLASLIIVFLWPLLASRPLINNFSDVLEVLIFIVVCIYISYLSGKVQRATQQLKQSQSKHQSDIQHHKFITDIIDSMPNMIGYWDKDLRCQFANKAFGDWFTMHPKDLNGVSYKELTGDKLYSLNHPYIQNVLAGEAQSFERTLKKTNGSISNILAYYIPDFDTDGSVKGFSIQSSEVTVLKETEAQLKLAACVFGSTVDGVLITDINGIILSVNPAFSYITGYEADEAIGMTPRILKSYRQTPEFYTSMWESIASHGFWSGEIWNRRRRGDLYLGRLNISMVRDENGEPLRYISVFSDVTDLWHKDEHLKHLAFHDALTDLPNRTLLLERLGQKIISLERQQGTLAVMFLDLDGFKLINDTYGHNVGDELLKEISKRLMTLVRRPDIIARLGGDEFIFVLDNPQEKDEVVQVAERIISSINEPIEVCGNILNMNSSIGISMFPKDAEESNDLIEKADRAMYVSKASGQNNINFSV